ncbi:MAG TPA: hypothetical protein PLN33_03805 [Hyphomonadaceae bacterium]|nr:hypothetical protein [Hyphomonadaceae bacterium]HPN05363.1 hypothetical protein [Hyphomonadaceae bacterium]
METTVDIDLALKRYASDDGKRVLSIIKSGDHFRFVEEQLTHQPALNGLNAYDYWEEVHRSGLYETIEAAEREAMIGWRE